MKKANFILLSLLIILQLAFTQDNTERMDFEAYDPPSTLVVPEHLTPRAKFPFIDIHSHQ